MQTLFKSLCAVILLTLVGCNSGSPQNTDQDTGKVTTIKNEGQDDQKKNTDIKDLSFSELIQQEDSYPREQEIAERIKENPAILTEAVIDELTKNNFEHLPPNLINDLSYDRELKMPFNKLRAAIWDRVKSKPELQQLLERDDIRNWKDFRTNVSATPRGKSTVVTTASYSPLDTSTVSFEIRSIVNWAKNLNLSKNANDITNSELKEAVEQIKKGKTTWNELFALLDSSRLEALKAKDFEGFADEAEVANKKAKAAEEAAKLAAREAQRKKEQEDAKRKEEEKRLAPKGLDEAIKAFNSGDFIRLGSPLPVLRIGADGVKDFSDKYIAFAKGILAKNHIQNIIASVLNYDTSKIDPNKLAEFKEAQAKFLNWINLILSGAPNEQISRAQKNATAPLMQSSNNTDFMTHSQTIGLAAIGLNDFDQSKEIAVKGLKAMNEVLKKDYGLTQPNNLVTLADKLENLKLDGTTTDKIKESIANLDETNKSLQDIVKKFK